MLRKAIIITLFLSILTIPLFTSAVSISDQAQETAEGSGINIESIYTYTGKIVEIFLGMLGVLFIILTIYAGFMWMVAGGDATKLVAAKQILIAASVGLIITLAAFALTIFVLDLVGVQP